MIAVGYFDGMDTRRGLLVWQEPEGEAPQALGGFDPRQAPGPNACTVVTTDTGERVLEGWVHPDQLAELHGEDGPDVQLYYHNDGKLAPSDLAGPPTK